MEIWPRILTIVEAGEPCVLVTVLADRGSVPRAAGARMIVRADGGFHGTIGGGALEWQALARAQALVERVGARTARRRQQQQGDRDPRSRHLITVSVPPIAQIAPEPAIAG